MKGKVTELVIRVKPDRMAHILPANVISVFGHFVGARYEVGGRSNLDKLRSLCGLNINQNRSYN